MKHRAPRHRDDALPAKPARSPPPLSPHCRRARPLPWRVCAARGEGLLTFAGLHESWRHPPPPGMGAVDADRLDTFTILKK